MFTSVLSQLLILLKYTNYISVECGHWTNCTGIASQLCLAEGHKAMHTVR